MQLRGSVVKTYTMSVHRELAVSPVAFALQTESLSHELIDSSTFGSTVCVIELTGFDDARYRKQEVVEETLRPNCGRIGLYASTQGRQEG